MTMKAAKPGYCTKPIYDHPYGSRCCIRKAVVERDGQPYCKQHDPEAVKARRAESDRKHKAIWDAKSARWDREGTAVAFVKGVPIETLKALAGAGFTLDFLIQLVVALEDGIDDHWRTLPENAAVTKAAADMRAFAAQGEGTDA